MHTCKMQLWDLWLRNARNCGIYTSLALLPRKFSLSYSSSDHKNLTSFITIKVLNCRQARRAELFANYDFILFHTSSKKNSADGSSCRLDYSENPLPQSALISLQALRFLPLNSTGVHAAGYFISTSRQDYCFILYRCCTSKIPSLHSLWTALDCCFITV